MAEVTVFKDKQLFSSIDYVEPVQMESADGKLTWLNSGGMTEFGFAYYWREIPVNILSFGSMVDSKVRVNYLNNKDVFEIIKHDGTVINFGRYSDNLYMGKLNNSNNISNITPYKKVYMFSVRDKLAKYNKSEIARAEKVKELMWNLGVVSTSQLIKQLRTSKIEEPGCSPVDVNIAIDIWGPDLAGIKGKSISKKNKSIRNDYSLITTRELQTAYGDVMFWLGKPYLVIVLQPLELLLITKVRNRSEEELYKATNKLLTKPIKAGFSINTLYFDREGGIVSDVFKLKLKEYKFINTLSFKDYDNNNIQDNIEIEINGSTSGIDIIERQIRVIKERARGIMNVLPYELPESMEEGLISFCVSKINSEIKATGFDNRSPRERFNGRVNSKSWIRHGFGNYCQVHSDNNDGINYNGPESRTVGALSLFPVDNVMGTWAYINLSTWKIIFRNRATSMPISDDIILHINNNSNSNSNVLERSNDLLQEKVDIGGNNHVIDHHVEIQNEIIPNIINDEINVTNNEDTSEGDHNSDINIEGNDVVTATTEINNDYVEGLIEDVEDGNIVTRSARIRNANAKVVSYVKGTNNMGRGEYSFNSKRYNKVKRIFLAKKAKGTMSIKEGIDKLGYEATKAIVIEMQQLIEKDVLEGRFIDDLTLDELKRIITCRMFLKEKTNADGVFEKVKARLVAGGHLQDRDVYDNGSSPTASTTVVFIESAIAAKLGNAVAHIDFSGAFLNADMPTNGDHVVHMRLNKYLTQVLVKLDSSYEKFVERDGTLVCRLKKALYGTIEAARLWYEMFVEDAKRFGYLVNETDMCVFRRSEDDGSISVLVLHVDDCLIRAKDDSTIDRIIKQWDDKYPGVTQHRGKKIEYIGMNFDFNIDGEVYIDQKGCVDKLMDDCHDVVGESELPHDKDLFNINENSILLDTSKQDLFHSRVQSLLYLGKRCKPDILTAVSFLGRRVKKANEEDWNKLGKVIKYIRRTRNVGIRLKIGGVNNKLKVTAFVDVSFACHADKKSHTGCSIFIGETGSIYNKSSRQSLMVKSSAEAELVGATDLAGAYLWIKKYLQCQEYEVDTAVDLRQDNQAVITWLKNGKAKDEKGRHISIRYFWLADRVKRGNVVVNYTNTKEMIADYLSKPLGGALFNKFRNVIIGLTTWKE